MPTLTWLLSNEIEWADLALDTPTTVGRRTDANIVVDDETVSRLHFLMRKTDGGFAVENLSQSTNTLVGGTPIAGAKALTDGDIIGAGNVSFTFHNLSFAPGRHEMACSHCGRNNGLERRECWFCGTSLVNALTAGFKSVTPWARLVGRTEELTLFSGQAAAVGAASALEVTEGAGDDNAVVIPGASGGTVRAGVPVEIVVDKNPIAGDVPLRHGMSISVGGNRHLVLLPG